MTPREKWIAAKIQDDVIKAKQLIIDSRMQKAPEEATKIVTQAYTFMNSAIDGLKLLS